MKKLIKKCLTNGGLAPTIVNASNEVLVSLFLSKKIGFLSIVETITKLFRDKDFKNLDNFTPGMFGYSILRSSVHSDLYQEILSMCLSMDMHLEGLHTETGPGVIEAAITVDDALLSADKAILFKTFMKVLAQRNNLMANFMAKWSENYPGK